MTSPEDLPLRNGEDSGNTDNGVVRERGQRTLKGDDYSANMKRLDDLNKDLAEFNRAKKFEDYKKSVREAAMAGDVALVAELVTRHEAETNAEYSEAVETEYTDEDFAETDDAEETGPSGSAESAEAGENEPVTVEETVKKHHMSKAAKKAWVVGIATALATVGTIVAVNIGGSKSSGGGSPSTPEPTPTTVTAPEAPKIPVAEKHESIAKLSTYKGQFASEDGKTFNKNKNNDIAFGEPLKSGLAEDEMKEEFGSRMLQPAQLATTYYYMREKTSNPNFGIDDAKFNSPNKLTDAMNSDPELHQKVYDFVISTISNNKLSEGTVNGSFDNFYMTSEFETGDIDTSRVEIVGCTTEENGTKVYKLEYVWADEEGIHTDIFTFKERCGGQPLDEEDFTTTVRHIPEKETTSDPTDDTTNEKTTTDEGEDDTTKDNDEEKETPTKEDDKGNEPTTDDSNNEQPVITPAPPSTENPIPSEIPIETVTPAPERGKSGDPHGGTNVTPSDFVSPETKITKEENDATNQNNQGYVDDHRAAPGSASENNGVVTDATPFVETEPKVGVGFAESGITASNAANSGEGEFGQRIYGNENQATNEQGNAEVAGTNIYHNEEANEIGRAIDQAGNNAQEIARGPLFSIPEAQQPTPEVEVGQDNYTNEAEEAAVASEDF